MTPPKNKVLTKRIKYWEKKQISGLIQLFNTLFCLVFKLATVFAFYINLQANAKNTRPYKIFLFLTPVTKAGLYKKRTENLLKSSKKETKILCKIKNINHLLLLKSDKLCRFSKISIRSEKKPLQENRK